MESDLYWHFLKEDRRLQFGERALVEVGQTLTVPGELVMCKHGLHASRRAIDALKYSPGPIICRVRLGGEVKHDSDKSVASDRTVLAMADATKVLHEFACRCAVDALRTAKVEDKRCWNAIETKLRWLRGEATDEELDTAWDAAWAAAWAAARDAAWAAAWDAAWAAAWAAARDTAWAAAWAAARDTAWAAARDTAWAAARDAQNIRLESMLSDLLKG